MKLALPTLPLPKNQKAKDNLSDPNFKVYMNQVDEDDVELLIFESIGEDFFGGGVTALQVADFLAQNKEKHVNVRINSPGGLAFDGITIYNSLKDHPGGVTTTIEGLAGSAAAIIAFAGNPLRMQETAQLFVHKAWTVAIGNSDEMLETAEFLDKLDGSIALIMSKRSGKSKEEMMELLKGNVDGNFLTAEEALELNLVDVVLSDDSEDQDDEETSQNASESLQKARNKMLLLAQSKLDLIERDLRV